MSARPSDHAIAQAFWEMRKTQQSGSSRGNVGAIIQMGDRITQRAREIDADRLAALAPVTPAPARAQLIDTLNLFYAMGQAGEPNNSAEFADRMVTPASGVDWRAMYRFQTAMRFMDNVPKLTRDRAYQMADDEMRGLEAQTQSRDQGEG